MELVADLHTHSRFSRATSKNSTLEGLYQWGKIKGITVVGTGDFTHPAWFEEMREKLDPAEPGLFKLKSELAQEIDRTLPLTLRQKEIRFILTAEISNIYSKNERVRKLHILLAAPSLETVSALNDRLSHIGNLKSDGRPILGLDSKDLLSIILNTNPEMLFIPAHIWTPWFSMLGSKSGFNSIKEAFEELAPEIKIIETGLSSDPFMNWRVSELEKVTIISNSDAHSPEKLGREATILDCPPDYFQIAQALKSNDQRVVGTIEFFPQEGKYHFDGHRQCGIRFSPQETKTKGLSCPVCGKILTIGVDHRVEELADHPGSYQPPNHKAVEYIIPLPEILGEISGVGPDSNAVRASYDRLTGVFGSEFDILRKTPTERMRKEGFPQLAEAIEKMRKREVLVEPGYDGVYGIIKLFGKGETKTFGQTSLF